MPDSTEAADWSAWLDKFHREIWPVFQRRGYSLDAAAIIYFTRIPDSPETIDDDEDED